MTGIEVRTPMAEHIHGGDIYSRHYDIDFSTNINPMGMPRAAVEAAIEGVRLSGRYPDPQCTELAEAVSRAEQVPADWLLFGCGAAELIYDLARAIGPRSALLVSPGFFEYEQALTACGCADIRFYPCTEENGFRIGEDYLDWLEDFDDPAATDAFDDPAGSGAPDYMDNPENAGNPDHADKRPDMIYLCNPGNPTGVEIDRELLGRILQVCRRNRIVAVVDECFTDLMDDAEIATVKAELEHNPYLVVLRAFTKTYAMPGLRLGYAICPDSALLTKVRNIRQPWSLSVPAQMAGAAALTEPDFLERSREMISRERAFLRGELIRLGLTVYDSRANYVFFRGPEGLTQRLGEAGILIRDCSNYRGLGEGYYRIAVRTQEENRVLTGRMERCLKPSILRR